MGPYIGCQTIVDVHGSVFGYEFHCNAETFPNGTIPDYGMGFMQSARVLVSLLSHHNIPQFSESHRVFMNVPSGVLLDEPFLRLIPESAVLIIYASDPTESIQDIAPIADALNRRGIGIAIDDAGFRESDEKLCCLADYMKVDVASHKADRFLSASNKSSAKVIAKNIHSAEDYDLALQMGAKYFQGSFIHSTSKVQCNGAYPDLDLALKLLDLLERNAGAREIEEAISRAPNILVRLLTYANSPLIGANRAIHSAGEAIALLGYQKLYTLVVLMLYIADGGMPQALIQRVLYRGKLMELVGKHHGQKTVHEVSLLFLIGLLSMFESIYPVRLADIVKKLRLPELAASALLDRSGEYGSLLSLVESCSEYDLPCVERMLDQLNIDADSINNYQFEAIEWSGITAGDL